MLIEEICRIHTSSRETYGSPRIHAQLQREGLWIGRKRVERLMVQAEIAGRVRRRFRKTTDSAHAHPIAPNLVNREFDPPATDMIWVSDITYIWVAGEWLYLAAIMDLHSRLIVGWALADHMRTELVEAALESALGSRMPTPGMVHHSDRGSQYASNDYRERLEALGIQAA